MRKKHCKFLFSIIVSLISVAVVFAAGCSAKVMQEVPFNLDAMSENFNPSKITYISSTEEFNAFLCNREVFKEELSQDFIDINKNYGDDYFESNNLVALILHAPSQMVKGYRLNKIYRNNDVLVLNLSQVSEGKYLTMDMGRYFCYYVCVDKDESIKGVEIEYK